MAEIKQELSYLAKNKDEILKAYKAYGSFFANSTKLETALNDDLLSLMEKEALKMSGKQAQQDNANMAVAINFFKKIIDHKSQIYTLDVKRTAPKNQELVDKYSKLLSVNNVFKDGNKFDNASKSCLIEMYQDKKGNLNIRPIFNNKFFVWSDDTIEPHKPTVYVKVIKTIEKKKRNSTEADVLHIYTDTEIMVLEGTDIVKYIPNPFGVAPFVYVNAEQYKIMPTAKRDTLHNIIQVNNIFTNANVCSFYQGHPIRVLKNVDQEQSSIPINPNDFIVLNSRDGAQFQPELDELASSLDVSKSIALAKEILEQMLSTENINAKDAVQSGASGVSLQLKSTDIVEDKKAQIERWQAAEIEFWDKLAVIHNKLIELKQSGSRNPVGAFTIIPNEPICEVEFPTPDTAGEMKDPKAAGEKQEPKQGE